MCERERMREHVRAKGTDGKRERERKCLPVHLQSGYITNELLLLLLLSRIIL